ncbi:succinate dehydrogenase, cytochrome b556 subunit [Brevibacterium litoralis]|uniref:succinate dehydrogenase, cytochrome b556 subunit n=1 Tax=Brevibacterium litoralis TaxID=3138935 RepID=UPI0032F00EA5
MAKASTGTLYRGHEGMWSWVAHRVTGVAIFFFLLVHVLDTALVRVSPEAYNAVIASYKTWFMGIGEIGLVAAIVYHAFNGLRVVAVDFWKGGPKNQKKLFWGAMILWLVVMIAFVPRQLMHIFGG